VVEPKKVLVVPLTREVEKWVKENYGPTFSVSGDGEVFKDKEDRPYPVYCGRWFVHNNSVMVIVDK